MLYLITLGWKTGKDHRLEIWFVEYNEKYCIISEHLDKAHWIQNIKHNPRIKFSIYAEVLEGTPRILVGMGLLNLNLRNVEIQAEI